MKILPLSGSTLIGLVAAGCADNSDKNATNGKRDAGEAGSGGAIGRDASPSGGAAGMGGTTRAKEFLYVASNDPTENAVLAFTRGAYGRLAPVPNGRFVTGGAGLTAGKDQHAGPLDSDQSLVLSGDKKYLFAANSGGNSIAVFRTAADGKLTPVEGSPFPSGGKNPVSIGQANGTLYVANKASDGSVAPSYTALRLNDDGTLEPVGETTVNAPMGGSPSIAYVSPNHHLFFGTEFFDGSRASLAPMGQIDAFTISLNGALGRTSGSPYALPLDTSGISPPPVPLALDLVSHPEQNVLYVGFVTRNQLGVYTYDDMGKLSFVTAKSNSGEGIGHFLVNAKATRLYAVDSGSASITVYTIENPTNPKEMGAISLKQAVSGPPFMDATGTERTITSQPFQLALDEDAEHLYIVSQRVTTNAGDPAGNYLHTLDILGDGTLTETAQPLDLRDVGVPPIARPEGVVVY